MPAFFRENLSATHRLIYMLYILCVRLTIKVKVGIPESFKVGWYRHKITGSSHLKLKLMFMVVVVFKFARSQANIRLILLLDRSPKFRVTLPSY